MTRHHRISESRRQQLSEQFKKMHTDPAYAAANSKRMKRRHESPDFRAKSAAAASANMTRLHGTPEFAAAASERMKQLHCDPEFAGQHAARSSERLKRLNADPEVKAKQLAARQRMRQLRADWPFKRGNPHLSLTLN